MCIYFLNFFFNYNIHFFLFLKKKDITSSQDQDEGCCGANFDTVAGWDPYTGLGTPNFAVLSKLAMSSSLFPSFKK